jgi:hypothetical protein
MAKRAASQTSELRLNTLLADFRLLVMLFVAFRFMLLMVYQPFIVDGIERGLTAQGDLSYYYALAQLSGDDLLPYRDWWSEFPPVWTLLTVMLYQMQGANVNYTSWAMLVGLIMLAFDTGNLILLRKIGTRLHGAEIGMAVAWVYAVLLAPLIFLWWTFETMVAFFLLLGLWWLLQDKPYRSALAAAWGALIKFTPALLLGAVFRFRGLSAGMRYVLIVVGIFALAYLPLLAQNAVMTLPSLTAQFGKASYQTVWALLDGNYRTGIFGDVVEHLDPSLAGKLTGNPAVVPGWLRLAAAAVVGLWIYSRTQRFDDRGLVAFVGITLLIFFLQAQGWSPQWLVQIIPLILLTFPSRNGIYGIVLLSLMTFAEYPFLFIRTGDTGGEIVGALVLPFVILVLARTLLLIGFCVGFYRRLRQHPVMGSS